LNYLLMGASARSYRLHELTVKLGESVAEFLLTITEYTFNFALGDASGVRLECSLCHQPAALHCCARVALLSFFSNVRLSGSSAGLPSSGHYETPQVF
jgi:hypothetical protein